jgi:hypothetical protein
MVSTGNPRDPKTLKDELVRIGEVATRSAMMLPSIATSPRTSFFTAPPCHRQMLAIYSKTAFGNSAAR